jgi:hypothetical protein
MVMNILLDYYYKDVREPHEVQLKTNEYREENNYILNWFEEHIIYNRGGKLSLKDACALFFMNKPKVGVKEKSKLRKELENCIKKKYSSVENTCTRTTLDGEPFHGWEHLSLKL